MEGQLLVPPDRGAIIGRAVWKSRYIVLGSPIRAQKEALVPKSTSTSRLQAARKGMISAPSRPTIDELSKMDPEQVWLSIYKQKGDWEAIAQYQVTSLRSCEIQNIQVRKPGSPQPTLVITFEPDPAEEKTRRRRSSRAAAFTSSTTQFPNTLLFRSAPDEMYNMFDWQINIQPLLPENTSTTVLTPTSPLFNSFSNPFSSKSKDSTPSSRNGRPDLHHRGSSTTQASITSASLRDRLPQSKVISPSPSLRSKRSDISSQASNRSRPQGGHSTFPIQHPPSDLPSPISVAGYDDQLISGWTSAQGRSSALSSHTRGSNSVSVSSTPPAPRETILDRAFNMHVIPGSDQAEDGACDQMSSIARFEALMRETEERAGKGKSVRQATLPPLRARGWDDLHEEDEEGDLGADEIERPNSRGESGQSRLEVEDEQEDSHELMSASIPELPTQAQRALEYISGRSTPLPGRPESPLPSQRSAPPIPATTRNSALRHGKSKSRPLSLAVPATTSFELDLNAAAVIPSPLHKRQSSTSTKRLSFNEFTRRLSSTSSLLLVQTNHSSGSVSSHRLSHASSEASFTTEDYETTAIHRGLSQSRLSGMVATNRNQVSAGTEKDVSNHARDKERESCKTGWRGSGLGVFGTGGEGNFF